jgi:hypothetical protein
VIAQTLDNKKAVVKITAFATFVISQAILLPNAQMVAALHAHLVANPVLHVSKSQKRATTAVELTWLRIALSHQMETAILALLEVAEMAMLQLAAHPRESSATTVEILDISLRSALS